MIDLDAWKQELLAQYNTEAAVVFAQTQDLAAGRFVAAKAWTDLRQFLDCDGRAGATLRQFVADPLALELLLLLGGVSRYAFDLCRQFPGMFWAVVQERQFRQVWGRRAMAAELHAELALMAVRAHRLNAIGRFKHQHFLRVIVGDLSGALAFESIVRELSDITAVVAQACLDQAVADQRAQTGWPNAEETPRLGVIAMGKLGARELNYSSDIDLIFVYEAVENSGDIDWHDRYQRLGTAFIALLEQPGDHGRCFRVDMRLRPEGDRGELALSRREMSDYYYSVGRPWERQALIKASALCGDMALVTALLTELAPWIFPQEPIVEDLDEARAMRRRIEERAQPRNVKTGAGGIRDIEFLVQWFQLAYGGRLPELRLTATLPTLHLLADRALLPRADAAEMARHYRWLREVEHRLQMWDDRQEHELPVANDERAQLAHRCGFTGVDGLARFDARHAAVRKRVRELCARHFLGVTPQQDAALALLVQGEADAALAATVLGEVGFKDLSAAARNVRALAVEPFFLLSRSRTERRLLDLLPLLLHQITQAPDPDQCLANLVRFVSAVGGRATFYELLGQRADLLAQVVDFCGWATFLVELFAQFPGLPDELMDALNRGARPASALLMEARALIQGIHNPTEPLAFLVARETAITAVNDLQGMSIDAVGTHLSLVADIVAEVALSRIVRDLARDWGAPVVAGAGGRPTRFALLALGKLGGGELGYASDMDVLFVCDPGGECPRNGRGGEEFWERVARELMRQMGDGRLYELDPRLRPWGDQGELVSTIDALRRYWQEPREPRELWERLAMVRIRRVTGDQTLADEAIAVVLDAALGAPLPADARAQVRAMRLRLEHSVADRDHVKRGPGGYVDHEFIAQFFALGLNAAALPRPAGTVPLLTTLGALNRIPAVAATDLIDGLQRLRAIESRIRLATGKAVSAIPTQFGPRTEISRRCGFVTLAEFDQELARLRRVGREWFARLLAD